ncbi:MAG TPA: zf-HC2 domain-containing protein, partial [Gaiellaceae bacterium]|nr:zf-HC2 domain-containing protein [Gaiellaceae bacterium]
MPPSECQRAREAVSARLDGELSELGSARLSAHLRACAACAAYALEVAAVATRLRMAPLEQPSVPVALPARRRRP